jgi:hypothetical protein
MIARAVAAGLLLVSAATASPAEEIPVDVELVLAVDVSASIDAGQARLQREGYVAALTDETLIARIRGGQLGRIAVAYVEWADTQTTVVDWSIIEDDASARAFAAAIVGAPLVGGSATAMSAAVDYSVTLLGDNGIEGVRRVIDLSSDGRNSAGGPMALARQRAFDAGIVINGLPIVQRDARGQPVDPGLEEYFSRNVIGGAGAFLVVAEDIDAFPTAIRNKLFIEIAGACPANTACGRTQIADRD